VREERALSGTVAECGSGRQHEQVQVKDRSWPILSDGLLMREHRTTRYQKIVERVTRMTRKGAGKPISIADICRAADVTPHTLARAFRAIHGVLPSHYLCEVRLAQARQALLSAYHRAETVTKVAMRFGFCELGGFAALYRTRFGENPSATLRRSGANIRDLPGVASIERRIAAHELQSAEPNRQKFAAGS
jgi:transcriptional regulator GlxA family with amidase domain